MADTQPSEIIDLCSPEVSESPENPPQFFINLADGSPSLIDEDSEIVELDASSEETDNKMDIDEIIPKNNAIIAEEKKNAGNDEYKLKNYKQAEKYYTEAINLCPEQAAYYGNRAAALMMLNDYAAALTDAKLSTQLDHGFAKGYMRMAKCCLALGDMVGTKQAIMKFLEIDPRNTALKIEIQQLKQLQEHQEKATASYEKEDWRTCLFHMENSLKVSPACARFKVLKAECMAMLGRYEQASDIAIAVMQMDQFNAEAIYVRGLTLYYTDNLDKSITHFQRVVKLDNDHKKAFQMRQKSRNIKNLKEEGNQLFKEQKYREALKAYTEALTIDATNNEINSKLYYNRSLVNTKLGNLLDAIIDCTEALKRNDKYVKALMKRAKCYYDLEKYEECVKDYEALAKIQKTDEIRSALKNAKLQLKKSKRKDYYKILGIGKSANDDEIKKAYRKRALIHHPDRHANSTEEEKKEQEVKFKEVGEAYTVLSDPNKKSRYDNGQDLDDDGHGMDIDPNQMFRQFFSFTADDTGFPRGHGGHQSGFNFHFG